MILCVSITAVLVLFHWGGEPWQRAASIQSSEGEFQIRDASTGSGTSIWEYSGTFYIPYVKKKINHVKTIRYKRPGSR